MDFSPSMSPLRILWPRVVVLVTVMVMVTACEVGAVQTSVGNPTPDPVNVRRSVCNPSDCQVLAVQVGDFSIIPSDLRVSSPRVQFIITNGGTYTHSLEVRTSGGIFSGPNIGRGQTAAFEVDLDPGAYEVLCPIPGHAIRGERATIIVVSR